MLAFDVISIFPDFFRGPLEYGIVGKAREKSLIRTRVHDLRTWTLDRHQTVDDRPFGGGEGMVLKPEPLFAAVEAVRQEGGEATTVEVVALSASGKRFDQPRALRLSKADQVILLCGRYEGIDERVVDALATAELSIGDFVVSGGEIAAVVVIDAVTRYVPGAVGKEGSVLRDSFSDPGHVQALVEHPHYTRPADFRGMRVPEVLLSGDHESIRQWRHREALKKTARNRPDLIDPDLLDEEDRAVLSEENHERH